MIFTYNKKLLRAFEIQQDLYRVIYNSSRTITKNVLKNQSFCLFMNIAFSKKKNEVLNVHQFRKKRLMKR